MINSIAKLMIVKYMRYLPGFFLKKNLYCLKANRLASEPTTVPKPPIFVPKKIAWTYLENLETKIVVGTLLINWLVIIDVKYVLVLVCKNWCRLLTIAGSRLILPTAIKKHMKIKTIE